MLVMKNEKSLSREYQRIPEISRRASQFLADIETATLESPASLDVLVDRGNLVSTLENQLGDIEELYDRHAGLFFDGGRLTPRDELDYEAILNLSRDVLRTLKRQEAPIRAGGLGLATLQFAEAAGQAGRDPSLLRIQDHTTQDLPEQIINKTGQLAREAFEMYQGRIAGDIFKVPAGRMGYIGSLAETCYQFWSSALNLGTVQGDIRNKASALTSAFPAKIIRADIHSLHGRPPRSIMRDELYLRPMEALKETLETRKARAWSSKNTRDAAPFVFQVLDNAMVSGYSAEDSLRIATHNSAIMARLTERRLDDIPIDGHDDNRIFIPSKDRFRFIEDDILPTLVIDHSVVNTREQVTGMCTARNPILLRKEGPTHRNIQDFSTTMAEIIGVEPPVLRNVGADVYADPAALTFSYVIFAIAINYHDV